MADVKMEVAKSEESDTTFPHETVTDENFRDVVLDIFEKEVNRFKNCWAYLDHFHKDRSAFADQLRALFPQKPEVEYLLSYVIPSTGNFSVSLWHLNWGPDCSTKPVPDRVTVRSLLDEYLTSGVATRAEPLMVYQAQDPGRNDFILHFAKGAARSAACLVLASLVMRYGFHLKTFVQESMCEIHVTQADCGCDIASVALFNAKMSARGDIRKAHCCLTWLAKMMVLKKHNHDATSIIKEWNRTCTKDGQIKGAKHTALLSLLNLPQFCVDALLEHLNEFGSQGAFNDNQWSNKKVLPGGGPKGYPREWNSRLQVTDEGFCLMIKYLDNRHRMKLAGSRCKFSGSDVEEAALVCQLLHSLVHELEDSVPLQVKEDVCTLLVQGDMNLLLQLQGALSEKRSNLAPADILVLREYIQKHVADGEKKLRNLGAVSNSINPGQLERQEFDLAIASMRHDMDVYGAWLVRSRDREAGVYHQNLQWRLGRQNRAKEMAEGIMRRSSETWRMEFAVLESAAQGLKTIQEAMKYICRLNQISAENLKCIVILNWCAPSLFSSQVQRDQASLMGAILNGQNAVAGGVCLTPTFTYNKGQLHKTEQEALRLLAESNLNLDHVAVVPYKGRNDDREKRFQWGLICVVIPGCGTLVTCDSLDCDSVRPLLMLTRILMPMDEVAAERAQENWRLSAIFRKPLLEEADLPQTRDLLAIEDLDPAALPTTTDAHVHVPQPEKAMQIGESAARSILRGFLAQDSTVGATAGTRSAFLCIDLSPHTCDFSRAALAETKLPVYYLGLTRSEGELEWSKSFVRDWLADSFLDGSLQLPPTMSLPPIEMPTELQQAAPPLPNLQTLLLNKVQKYEGLPSLKTPDRVLAAWGDHARFKTEFEEFLQKSREELPLDLTPEKADKSSGAGSGSGSGSGSGLKREADGTQGRVAKKQKVETLVNPEVVAKRSIPLKDLPKPLTWEADLHLPKSAKAKVSVIITLGERIFLVNHSQDKDVVLEKNTCVAGFYKGKWWQHKGSKDQASVKESDILFTLKDADSLIQIGSKVHTLGEAVQEIVDKRERRKTQPDVTVSYHKICDSPTSTKPAFFTMSQTHTIYWEIQAIPADCIQHDGKTCVPVHHMGGVIPFSRWETWASTLVWASKWSPTSAKGLVPCRPLIVLKESVPLSPQTAIELTASEGPSAEPVA
ncbi:unnamed protein product [Symbiodinium sp. CCMP2592]|nr:unnamed protein product [Symbiodinium sp. CCMP2592]